MEKTIEELISARNTLAMKEKILFIESVERINLRNKDILRNDLGATLAQNIARDLAGEVVRRYFDMGDYYITVDQLIDRFLNFSYDNDQDLFMSNENIRKNLLNASDSVNSQTIKDITQDCQGFQSQLFSSDRANDKFDIAGKKNYRNNSVTNIHEENGKFVGTLRDELSGREVETTTKPQNKNDWYSRDLQADHKIPREAITYNGRYIKDDQEILDKYREFYNSDPNFQMMLASANGSKGDIRVCRVNGEIKYVNPRSNDYDPKTNITMSATADQLTDAAVFQWENAGESAKEAMKNGGYLDENGKVKKEVRENYKKQMEELIAARNQQLGDLADFDYANIAKDSANRVVKKSIGKIVAGQLIYYIMPPVLFETQQILRKKDISLKNFFDELKKAEKRIIAYVKSKLSDIFINIAGNSLHKFVKVFFDTVIEMAKETVKKMLQIVKDIVLSLVNCCKTIVNPNMTSAQKADAITKIMYTTINAIVLEIIFEYLEKQFGIPDTIMEPLQVIVTIISTNVIMLSLNEADLFNVKYGLLTAKLEKVFDEENEKFESETRLILSEGYEESNDLFTKIEHDIKEIVESINLIDIRNDDVVEILDSVNRTFSMGIDFNKEWEFYRKGEVQTT